MSKIKVKFTDLVYIICRPELKHFQIKKIARKNRLKILKNAKN